MSFCISLTFKKFLLLQFFLFFFSFYYSQNIDSNSVYTLEEINISGNKKTKNRIIIRELSHKTNDTIRLSAIPYFKKRSEQNIFNTLLFIYDTIYPVINHETKTIKLNIVVKERWYIWPVPVFEIQDRNLNTWWRTKDLFRINYGFALGLDNFTGVKDRLVLLFQRGYSEQYGFSYSIPYLNKAQTLGFKMLYVYGRNNEVTYTTQNNLPQFVREYKQYLRMSHEGRIGFTHRPNLYVQSNLDVVLRNNSIKDTVIKLNTDYFGSNLKMITYGSLQYRFTFDNRDNKQYATKGWMFDLWAIKDGFDLTRSGPVNYFYIISSLKKHSKINNRVYLANSIKGRWINVEQQSYNFNRALGYSDLVRGYEYYIMDGQNFFLNKNSVRYQLIKPRVYQSKSALAIKQFNTIPYYAFVNLFFDAAFVEDNYYDKTNTLTNNWQYGYGIGFDFVTYYDIVLRLEYSFNKQNLSGFFIHFTSGF